MKIDFLGFFRENYNEIKKIDDTLDSIEELANEDSYEASEMRDSLEYANINLSDLERHINLENSFDVCHDIILGIVKGDCNIDELKDFMFQDKDIDNIAYKGAIIFKKV